MTPEFWHNRWLTNQIGFHQAQINPHLLTYWECLNATSDQSVLLPLCGKSLDLKWLSQQNRMVTGIELSPIAVRDFFSEAELPPPSISESGPFTVSTSNSISLYCGDFFKLQPEMLSQIPPIIYDRAALIALPTSLRQLYVETINRISSKGTKILLISLSYPETEMQGPPFNIPAQQISKLYSPQWKIKLHHQVDILSQSTKYQERGLSSLYEHIMILEKQ